MFKTPMAKSEARSAEMRKTGPRAGDVDAVAEAVEDELGKGSARW